MAKKLGLKSQIIRTALAAAPSVGNTDLAEKLNGSPDRLDDKLTFTAQDIASQKQAMKNPGAVKVEAAPAPAEATPSEPEPAATTAKPVKMKPGRKPRQKAAAPAAVAEVAPAKQAGVVEAVEGVFALAEQVGGMDQLKRLVDRLAGVPGR